MVFSVHSRDRGDVTAVGCNILPPFPAGTALTGYSVNGRRFPSQTEVVADGQPMVIGLDNIRTAIARGAPRTWGKRPLPKVSDH